MNQSTFELLQIGLGGQVEVVAARPPLKDGITLPLSTVCILGFLFSVYHLYRVHSMQDKKEIQQVMADCSHAAAT